MSERPVVQLINTAIDRIKEVKDFSGIINWEKELDLSIEELSVASLYLKDPWQYKHIANLELEIKTLRNQVKELETRNAQLESDNHELRQSLYCSPTGNNDDWETPKHPTKIPWEG
jgi:hypothetical protein